MEENRSCKSFSILLSVLAGKAGTRNGFRLLAIGLLGCVGGGVVGLVLGLVVVGSNHLIR